MYALFSATAGRPACARFIGVLLLALSVTVPVPLFAESVFMKDGSIIEGTIASENDRSINLKTVKDELRKIERSKVLRILYDNAYKKRVFIKTRSGRMIEGHIVEDSAAEVTVREKLDSPAEFKIEKSDIIATSSERFTSKGAYFVLGLIPGAAQLYAGKNAEGITFLTLFLVGGGLAGYTGWNWYDKHDKYHAVPRGSAKSSFDAAFDEYQLSSYLFIAALAFVGAVYVANWVDVIFFAKPDFGKGTVKSAAAGEPFFNVTVGDDLFRGALNERFAGGAGDPFREANSSYAVRFSGGIRF